MMNDILKGALRAWQLFFGVFFAISVLLVLAIGTVAFGPSYTRGVIKGIKEVWEKKKNEVHRMED